MSPGSRKGAGSFSFARRSVLPSLALLTCLFADAVVAGADVLAKRWAGGGGAAYLWTAWVLYAGVSGLWFVLLKMFNGDLGRSSVIWAATGVIAGIMIGVLMGERPTATQWIGIGLATAGVLLTSWK